MHCEGTNIQTISCIGKDLELQKTFENNVSKACVLTPDGS